MPFSALWRIPSVRRKYLVNWAMLALLLAPCPFVLAFGTSAFPTAFPLFGLLALLFVLYRAAIGLRAIGRFATRDADLVAERQQAPECWDAVQSAAERLGIPMPSLYFTVGRRKSMAFAWSGADGTGIVLHENVFRTFTPPMLKNVVAHELSHLRMGDTASRLRIRTIATWLNLMAIALFLVGVERILVASPMDAKIFGLLCCFVAAGAKLLIALVDRYLVPQQTYWYEYAADAVAAKVTGDPEGMIAVLMLIVLQRHDMRGDTRPRFGQNPPPFARVRMLLKQYPDALARTPPK
jgi:heat shock protein HtpX